MEPIADSGERIGIVMRGIGSDVKDKYKGLIYSLYSDKEGNCTGYRAACAKWHWDLIISGHDMKKIDRYITIIQHAYKNKINLDEDETWCTLMRLLVPSQFIRKITAEFTQVMQASIMDPTEYDKIKSKEQITDFQKADI